MVSPLTRSNAALRPRIAFAVCASAILLVGACSRGPTLDVSREYGPNPTIVEPDKSLLPRVYISKAVGWPAGAMPHPAPGLAVSVFSRGLQHPRWLYVLPNGDVLVAESQGPPRPDDASGISGWIHKLAMRRAGSGQNPSANRISILHDPTGAGTVVERHTFIEGLNSPIGMALVGDALYVADTDALMRFPYRGGELELRAPGVKVVDLPGGALNHHWTKSLIASQDGRKLYVGVGSNSNAGENGLDAERDRAAVWEIDAATGEHHVFASGLRNPVGLAWQPESGDLWVSVNERDELGDHVPPDYMTSLHEGDFFGFPFSYYGQHVDERVSPQNPALVAKAVAPDYALGAHTASLGLCWSAGSMLPGFQHGMFVGQHGSWNRATRSGYRVIYVPFAAGKPDGPPEVVLDGFLDADEHAMGRPAGVAIDSHGSLLVADDVGNVIWKVSAAAQP